MRMLDRNDLAWYDSSRREGEDQVNTGCCSGSAPRGVACAHRSIPRVALLYIGRGDAMGQLRLAVLGPPEVLHDGRRLTFALRKAQALLLYLAVEGGMRY